MIPELIVAFTTGMSAGGAMMWGYFLYHRLIRSRSEWYADRKARGYSVPDDWNSDVEADL